MFQKPKMFDFHYLPHSYALYKTTHFLSYSSMFEVHFVMMQQHSADINSCFYTVASCCYLICYVYYYFFVYNCIKLKAVMSSDPFCRLWMNLCVYEKMNSNNQSTTYKRPAKQNSMNPMFHTHLLYPDKIVQSKTVVTVIKSF
jgi:hypothetical protein